MVTEEHIVENYDTVRNMDSVASIRGNEFQGDAKKMRAEIVKLYDSYGNIVHNDVVGDIILNNRSVRHDLAHGYGDRKAAAFATVRMYLKRKVLRYSENWKGRSMTR